MDILQTFLNLWLIPQTADQIEYYIRMATPTYNTILIRLRTRRL